jgi:hypothetical protein
MNGIYRQETARRVVAAAILSIGVASVALSAPARPDHFRPHYSVSIAPGGWRWRGLENSYPAGVHPDVNNRAEVATVESYYDKDGRLIELPCVASRKGTNVLRTVGYGGWANALNNRSEVVGAFITTGNWWSPFYRACLWEHGRIRDLGGIAPSEVSEALAINERGQVVGYANEWDEGPIGMYALLWENGEAVDLSDCIDHDLTFHLWAALYITNQGEIYAAGVTWYGETIMFRLTPGRHCDPR